MTKFTQNQQKAIDSRDKSLLVSAGAGSGKTTVMIARIVDLIVRERVPISNFLVVTFTKASASDMKNKLVRALEANATDNFVLNQIEEVGTSDVSNLHSFCARLLKTYFYQIGLDPSFVVLDDVEMNGIKQKAMTKLLEEGFSNKDKELLDLVDILNKKRSEVGLSNVILSLREFMLSQTEPDEWFNSCVDACYNTDLDQNYCAQMLNKKMVGYFQNVCKQFNSYASIALNLGEQKLADCVKSVADFASGFSEKVPIKNNLLSLWQQGRFAPVPSKVGEAALDLKSIIQSEKSKVTTTTNDIKDWWGEDDFYKIVSHLRVNKERVCALFRLAKRYDEILTELKNSKGGLDFSDLERYTLKALEIPEVTAALKQKYKYIFVDEYQDINPVQEKILSLISNENNRFMVGDIKQSIYRFRLCNPDIFLEKYNRYKTNKTAGEVIDLKENFRSHADILAFCNFVFARAYTADFGGINYSSEGELVCGRERVETANGASAVSFDFIDTDALKESLAPQKVEGVLPLYSVAEDELVRSIDASVAKAEGSVIAEHILNLVGTKFYNKDGAIGRLSFRDMVILISSRGEYLTELSKTLDSFGIPVSNDDSQDIFEDEYVIALLNFLKIIDNTAQDYPLANCMRSPLFNFSANDLAQIKLKNPDTKFFYQAVELAHENQNVGEKILARLNDFYDCLNEFKKLSGFLTARELVTKIISVTKLDLIALAGESAAASTLRLNKFVSCVSDESLAAFLSDLDGLKITCQASPEGDAVRIMTIHSSKGLEFPVAILANCGKRFNPEWERADLLISKDLGVGLKYYDSEKRFKCDTFVRNAIKFNERFKIKEEQLRLLYVALTRAVNHLIVVGSGSKNDIDATLSAENGKSFLDWFSCAIVDGRNPNGALRKIMNYQEKDALAESKKVGQKQTRKVEWGKPDEKLLEEVKNVAFSKFDFVPLTAFSQKTSVTALNREEQLTVPVLFEESEKGQSAELGTAYHKVLERVDFARASEETILALIEKLRNDGEIDKDLSRQINAKAIEKIAQNDIIKNNLDGDFLREKEFIMALDPVTKKCSNKPPFMVVQGVCDLVIIKNNQIVLIDFKLSNKSPENLKSSYSEQIELYSQALKNSYNMPVTSRYICKVTTGEFIKI